MIFKQIQETPFPGIYNSRKKLTLSWKTALSQDLVSTFKSYMFQNLPHNWGKQMLVYQSLYTLHIW